MPALGLSPAPCYFQQAMRITPASFSVMAWILAAGAAGLLGGCRKEESASASGASPAASAPAKPGEAARQAGDHPPLSPSSACSECHEEATAAWRGSHHALAHRDVGNEVDEAAFTAGAVTVGDAAWSFTGGAGQPAIGWRDRDEAIEASPPMAIGLTPLVQYIVSAGDGRYQVPDMAWDPAEEEWFSIYGEHNRRPGDWGHWTGRGMNWNSQCAYCHFTGLNKGYEVETDRYETTWVEQGVGCAQCHGPDRGDAASLAPGECRINPERTWTSEQWMHSCATCHSRREELDEAFTIGDSFHDHYHLALPSQPGLWHPDGQQIDEVYKFNSFMLSRMGHRGITCTHCHDPHSNEPIGGRPAVESNALCMTCHAGGANNATIIDPSNHLFHDSGTPGGRCIDCHMPKRTYMARDPRSDHRFPIPDPLLTKEVGTPNACNDCHADKGLDWQIEWTDRWYGERMERPERDRTRAVHAAQQGEPGALGQLIEVYDVEEIDAWKATLLRLMEPWLADSRVRERSLQAARSEAPLTRAAAAFLVSRSGASQAVLDELLADPLKAVRLEAAWGAFESLPADHPAVLEAEAVARHQADQPAGAMRMARVAVARQDPAKAEEWMKRAARWDGASAAPRRDLAVFLGGLGRTEESVAWLEEAARLEPGNAEIPYLAALALAETGRAGDAVAKLERAVELEPGFARAHYNLGLLLSSLGRDEEAVAALRRAADADPGDPQAPYARATIHLRQGMPGAARNAAREAVSRAPDFQPAQGLLRQLGD